MDYKLWCQREMGANSFNMFRATKSWYHLILLYLQRDIKIESIHKKKLNYFCVDVGDSISIAHQKYIYHTTFRLLQLDAKHTNDNKFHIFPFEERWFSVCNAFETTWKGPLVEMRKYHFKWRRKKGRKKTRNRSRI